jgi:FAD/FMN-containing dehydrogenase
MRRAGGVAAAAALASPAEWLAACGSGGSSPPDFTNLARHLDGLLVLPSDHLYRKVSTPLNHRYANVHPQAVALCASADDARRSLLWARENEMPVAVRSGGHNYAGYSNGPGLVISFDRMRRVKVDDANGTLVVEPGARNTDVYRGLQPHGVAISAGRCPSVAIGGLTLGGGIGFSSRKLGLTCDRLTEAELITADGKLVTCNKRENSDLFWALRGGGGGNFGISTSYKFVTHPVSDVTLYSLEWDWSDAAKVFAAFQEVMAGAPEDFSARLGMGRPGKPNGKPGPQTINALGQFFGPKADLVALLDPALTVAKPKTQLIARRTFWQAKNYFFATTPIGYYETKSAYAHQPLSGHGIETLINSIDRWPGSTNGDGAGMAMFLSGGAINRVPADATAFVHRSDFAVIALETTWTKEDPSSVSKRGLDWIEGMYDALRPDVSSFAYQNFIDRAQPNWQHAYYGSNFARLKEIKRRHDPDDVFKFKQSIPLA